ncbi:MAG TPA: helix-turn-helix domain-containing protein [Candidatus Acetothermia bacterium]|nr:helix-turn-helix domain-containing protein [Candidatus Acetothermia bacterium]
MLEFKLTRETTEPVDRNLALLLLALANKYGALNADGTARLEFPITRQTMAELLGVSLETVMLMLRRFREREPIETRRSGGSRSSPGRRSRRSPAPPSSTAPFSSRRCKVPFEDLMESAQVPQEAPVDQLRSTKLHEAAHGLAKGISGHTQDRARVAAGLANYTCSLPSVLSPQRTSVYARARSGPARWRASVRWSSRRSASAERTRSRNGGRSKARAQASAVENRSVAAVRARANP